MALMSSHEHCLAVLGMGRANLTMAEQEAVAVAYLKAFRDRTDDFLFNSFTLDDRKSKTEIWHSTGRYFLSVYRPVETNIFRGVAGDVLWDGVHLMRHALGYRSSQYAGNLFEALGIEAPKDDDVMAGVVVPFPKFARVRKAMPVPTKTKKRIELLERAYDVSAGGGDLQALPPPPLRIEGRRVLETA